jgi:hypothetical protein
MEFTVELRYEGGSSTVLSVDADSADDALQGSRDHRRRLVGIHIGAAHQDPEPVVEARRPPSYTSRRVPVQHRPSRRRR